MKTYRNKVLSTKRLSLTRQLKIILPALLSLLLFGALVYWFILPQTHQLIWNKKLEMIREINNTAWSILASYEHQVQAGVLDRTEAEARAITRIRTMRYGKGGKDYFWINNQHPTMIMHPYRPELIGRDMSDYTDPQGKKIFLAFNDVIRDTGEGYVEYLWQWKDDPNRIEPKISYVKRFAPWQWIVGTGIYINDIEVEVSRMRHKLLLMGGGVFFAVALLAGYMMWRSIVTEKIRQGMEYELRLLANTDSLTGVFNRRRFWEQAEKEFNRASRYKHGLALILMDVDHFKRVNDTYGHPTGDIVLKALAAVCTQQIRTNDLFARIGGEEFACLLIEISNRDAVDVANRLRRRLACHPIVVNDTTLHITASIGLTECRATDCGFDDMVRRADKALYRAKTDGRNRVTGA